MKHSIFAKVRNRCRCKPSPGDFILLSFSMKYFFALVIFSWFLCTSPRRTRVPVLVLAVLGALLLFLLLLILILSFPPAVVLSAPLLVVVIVVKDCVTD